MDSRTKRYRIAYVKQYYKTQTDDQMAIALNVSVERIRMIRDEYKLVQKSDYQEELDKLMIESKDGSTDKIDVVDPVVVEPNPGDDESAVD